MKPKLCRECRRPMEYGIVEWRCMRGDCERALEPVWDRKRVLRTRRLRVAALRRARMRGIRQGQRMGVRRPKIDVFTSRTVRIWMGEPGMSQRVLHHVGGYHVDDGRACLHCDPSIPCHLHEVPF